MNTTYGFHCLSEINSKWFSVEICISQEQFSNTAAYCLASQPLTNQKPCEKIAVN